MNARSGSLLSQMNQAPVLVRLDLLADITSVLYDTHTTPLYLVFSHGTIRIFKAPPLFSMYVQVGSGADRLYGTHTYVRVQNTPGEILTEPEAQLLTSQATRYFCNSDRLRTNLGSGRHKTLCQHSCRQQSLCGETISCPKRP